MTGLLRDLEGREVTVTQSANILSDPGRSREAVEAVLSRLAPELRARDESLADREEAVREIRRLTEALECVTRSHSWRMTQPLRDIGQVVRDRRHGP